MPSGENWGEPTHLKASEKSMRTCDVKQDQTLRRMQRAVLTNMLGVRRSLQRKSHVYPCLITPTAPREMHLAPKRVNSSLPLLSASKRTALSPMPAPLPPLPLFKK